MDSSVLRLYCNGADSDADSLSDWEEVEVYKTDPLKIDTDGDWLSDYEEAKVWSSDPLNKDSDGDGWNDFIDPRIWIEDVPPMLTNIKSKGNWGEGLSFDISDSSTVVVTVRAHHNALGWVDDHVNVDYSNTHANIRFPFCLADPIYIHYAKIEVKDEYDNKVVFELNIDQNHGDLEGGKFTVSDGLQLIGDFCYGITAIPIVGLMLVPVWIIVLGTSAIICWTLGLTLEDGSEQTVEPASSSPAIIATYTDVNGNKVRLDKGFCETKVVDGKTYTRGYGWEHISMLDVTQDLIKEIVENGNRVVEDECIYYLYTKNGTNYSLIVSGNGIIINLEIC